MNLGSAFIYESRDCRSSATGKEPTRTLIGDLNRAIDLKPQAMTALVNLLPATSRTSLHASRAHGQGGRQIPNPNTKNEVYLDDFEGARSSGDLSMDALVVSVLAAHDLRPRRLRGFHQPIRDNAGSEWFNPFNVVQQKDLRPNLTRAEDSQASVTVMSWWVPQRWQGAPRTRRGSAHAASGSRGRGPLAPASSSISG
jgi:hypothetical protein